MNKSTLRVVFDTNAFTPGHFELLGEGPLPRLCRSRRIEPIYGHVFLEETFRAYGIEGKRADLVQSWLPFVAKTVDRLCADFVTIWHRELVQGQGRHADIFMTRLDQRQLLAGLERIPLDGSWRAWHASQQARDIEDAKRAAQRETSKQIRQEIADWRKAIGYQPKRHGVVHLADYFEREVDHAGREFLPALVKCDNPRGVANRWSRDKAAYPFFTQFIINMLYIAHVAMTKSNDKIDLNAQADLDVMTHLLRADALVTNETGFMRNAFDDLWRARGKVVFTSDEFAKFVAKI